MNCGERSLLILSIFLAFLLPSFSFAANPEWNGSGLDLNASAAKSIAGFKATINYTGDLNAVCFNTSDSSTSATCLESNQPSPFTIDLNSSVVSAASDGSYTIYAFLRDLDMNYSSSSSEALLIDNTAPAYTIYPVSGTDYNINDFTFDINFTDSSAPVTSSIRRDEATISDGASFTDLNEGTHTIYIDANDSLGNNLNTSFSFRVDTVAPYGASITSSNASTWTNNTSPDFNSPSATDAITGITGGKTAFSCSATGPWFELTTATVMRDFNIISTTYGCTNTDGNKIVYIKFRDKAGNIMPDSNAIARYVLLERIAPSAPTGLGASGGNAKVTLSWTTPVQDANSGNYRIEIFKNGVYVGDTNWGTTSYDVTGLTNGTTYAFKIRTKDLAGNYSDFTSEESAIPESATASISVKKNGVSVSFAKNGEVLDVVCSYSESADDAKIKYQYHNPDSTSSDLKTSSTNVTSLSEKATINTSARNYEKISFWCEASNSAGSGVHYVNIDNVPPSLEWFDLDNNFSGVKRVFVNASDNKSLGSVEFDFNNTKYNSVIDSNSKYYFDLNTLSFGNGDYSLKAIAFDSVGNKTEIIQAITISNILSEEQKAKKGVSAAVAKKQESELLIDYYKKGALVFPDNLFSKKSTADNLLAEAIVDLNSKYESALEKAVNASKLYDEFLLGGRVEETDTNVYVYDSNNLVNILKIAGLKDSDANLSAKIIRDSLVERSISILKAGSKNMRQINVKISFKNDTNSNVVKILEIIPKELVDSAKKIVSDTNFRIIKEDPAIEFSLPLEIGGSGTIVYGIGEVTLKKADSIISENIISKFDSPPIILDNSIKSENVLAGKGFSFGLGGLLDTLVIAIILIVIFAVGGLFYFRIKNKNKGFKNNNPFLDKLNSDEEKKIGKWGVKK